MDKKLYPFMIIKKFFINRIKENLLNFIQLFKKKIIDCMTTMAAKVFDFL